MSATNFWNNFTNGFLNGMFFNTPLFNCFNGFGGFNRFGFFDNCSLFSNSWNCYPNASFPSIFNCNAMPNASIFQTSLFNVDTGYGGLGINKTYQSKASASDEKITYDAAELKKTWSKKKKGLSDAFYNKVIQVAKNVNCSPNDLMALMYSESGLDSKIIGRNGATGLIQFIPKYVSAYGTTIEALRKMSNVEQMDYVEKYIKSSKKLAKISNTQKIDAGTLYSLVYLPAYANKEVLSTRENDVHGYYSSNKGLDANGDGKITKSELGTRLKKYYA